MDGSIKQTRKKNPKDNANIFSIATFFYTFSTFRLGYKKELEEDDIYEIASKEKCQKLGDRIEKMWLKELESCKRCKKRPSLWKIFFKVFGREYVIVGIIVCFVEIVIKVNQVLSLGELVSLFMNNDHNTKKVEVYIQAGKLIVFSLLAVLINPPAQTNGYLLGIRIRSVCAFLVYRKSLKLSKAAFGNTTSGQMMNILSNDMKNFERWAGITYFICVGPLQTVVLTYFMYVEIGPLAIAGVVFLLSFIPLQFLLAKVLSKFRVKSATRTDERIRLMNEIVLGITIIKMYTWEKPFTLLVDAYRRLEVKAIKVATYLRQLTVVLSILNIRVSVFVTLAVYVLVNNSLNARQVFILSGFYNLLRLPMMTFFPDSFNLIAEMNVSMKRLVNFLLLDEIIPRQNQSYEKEDLAIVLQDASAKWSETSIRHTLSHINLTVKKQSLVGVIGAVGSGKTSLLYTVLNELPLSDGTVNVQGTLSYGSQEPWLFLESIRQNILFGTKYNPQRYNDVVHACALETDFQLLPYADGTIIGERGASLSGGQRARVNLARAVYRKADIYLLDDPLSAVDTHVGKEIFNNCIKGYLRNKTVVLVTHQLQYLKEVDYIVILDNGSVIAQGAPTELQKTGIDFSKYLDKDHVDDTIEDASHKRNLEIKDIIGAPTKVQEYKRSGSLSRSTYLSYVRSGGNWLFILTTAALFILVQTITSIVDYFLAYWVNLEHQKTGEAEKIRRTCLLIYTCLIVVLITLSLVKMAAFTHLCMTASVTLHNNMFQRIVQGTVRFFNTNPSGRILNRFSKDTGLIDESLPACLDDTLTIGLLAIGVVIVVTVVNKWLLIPAVIIAIIFYFLRIYYVPTSRSLKRLDGVTRSPVMAYLNSSIQGLTTIRAFGSQNVLEKEFSHHQDINTSVACVFLCTSKAFGYYLDLFCVIYIGLVTISCVFIDDENVGGNVGLIISQSIALTSLLQWGVRQLTETENQMTSVERILEYSNIEQEPPLENLETKPESSWPEQGEIKFVNLYLQYFEYEPPVLKNINLTVKPLEKVGIVGRTGAGKSSLISALFRLANIEGSILIDDIDIKTLGLHDLRSKISIIPQEPVLFTGSMRRNLDPFVEFTDDHIWKALEDVELKVAMSNLSSGLDSEVSEGGSNLSVGQRQLVCLARAILRKNKILILDEATANVDSNTDMLIQKTIRNNFANCTVLTIAHRLDTVMDSDKILVMDAGEVVEFDHPYVLLQNRKGVLSSMVYQTGSTIPQTLLDVAKNAYEQREKS